LNVPLHTIQFTGPAKWEAGPGHAGITLIGKIIEPDGRITAAQLSLSGLVPPPLPPLLNDLIFEALTAHDMVLRSGGAAWPVRGGTWQLHRDVGAAFFAAIPPRPTPWARRLGWTVLLGLAALRPGRWLLLRLGGAK
jgi:hypothetical protein